MCGAGKAGYCNHVSALMFRVYKFTLFDAKTTKDLCQEKDENPELACTSQVQKWHKKGGGEHIVPQPVMDVFVQKTKLEEPSSSQGPGGVKCLLYEARKQPQYDPRNETSFKTDLAKIDPNMGFAQMSKGVNPSGEITNTKFGKTTVGSFLSYQTSLTESEADLNAVPRNNKLAQNIMPYPRFPLCNEDAMIIPRQPSNEEQPLISHLTVDDDKVNATETSTREQTYYDL